MLRAPLKVDGESGPLRSMLLNAKGCVWRWLSRRYTAQGREENTLETSIVTSMLMRANAGGDHVHDGSDVNELEYGPGDVRERR